MTVRNLSGIYFRTQDENDKWINLCFEELSKEEKDKIFTEKPVEWKNEMINLLIKVLNRINDDCKVFADDVELVDPALQQILVGEIVEAKDELIIGLSDLLKHIGDEFEISRGDETATE